MLNNVTVNHHFLKTDIMEVDHSDLVKRTMKCKHPVFSEVRGLFLGHVAGQEGNSAVGSRRKRTLAWSSFLSR